MAFGKPSKADYERVEKMFDWQRASGDCVCDICGHLYYDHHRVPGYEWLRMLCDGALVKL